MARLYLTGGPCHGQWIDPGDVSGAPATVVCRGYLYRFDGSSRYYAVGPAPTEGGDGGAIPGQRNVYRAWTRAMRALAVTTPHHVRQVARARARIKRVVK